MPIETKNGKAGQQQELLPLEGMEDTRRSRPRSKVLYASVAAVLFMAVLAAGILIRIRDRRAVRAVTVEMANPQVSVVSPKQATPTQEIVLPGNVQPYVSSPIYARTSGYLKKWYFDIGAHVKKGQLLAVIEAPEVDQQVEQSRSNLLTAKANLELAKITMDRYQGLLSSHAVSQQDADNATGTYNANKAIVEADTANVRQLEAIQSYEKVYAPFDGIITARNTDIGDLINAGSSNVPRTDLFHLSQPNQLRVYVSVPEQYARAATPGLKAQLVLPSFPGRRFEGTLARTSEAIIYSTRTLLVEISVDNRTGTLFSGSFAEVHLSLPDPEPAYLIPVSTLLFRSNALQVAVVKDGKVEIRPVMPARDFGSEIEIVHGLNADDQIIMNPPDSIVTGEKVEITNAKLKTGAPILHPKGGKE
jgi:RND family efflux transporter MFP subunit